jgi:hypothetical protein
MKQRSPAAVFLLSLITFGIYALVWEVKTKGELTSQGADIPTAWLLIIPLANLYWIWKYCVGVEKVSNGQISAVLALILMLLLSIVGFAILQSEFNKLGAQPAGAAPGPMPASDPAVATSAPVGPSPTEPTTATPDSEQPGTVSPDSGSSDSTPPSDTPPSQPPSPVE